MAVSKSRFGVMQGRLSPPENGLIQSFPWDSWVEEFKLANMLGIRNIEWTIDSDNLSFNPIALNSKLKEIKELSISNEIQYKSVTGDFLMQDPFWKTDLAKRERLLAKLDHILSSMVFHGCKILVVPLVDNGSCVNDIQFSVLRDEFLKRAEWLSSNSIRIAFEIDLAPRHALSMINQFPSDTFGINYDIGNSASLGFDLTDELTIYGNRIFNVHIKDRIFGGTTVPLGSGHANIPLAITSLVDLGYQGLFILQAARMPNVSEVKTISKYIDFMRSHSLLDD